MGWPELVFMLVVLKLPVVYLCCVVWWAIKAEPRPEEGAATRVALEPEPGPPCPWWRRRAALRHSPRGGQRGPARGPIRSARAAAARAEARK
jgi:hypothetical protein